MWDATDHKMIFNTAWKTIKNILVVWWGKVKIFVLGRVQMRIYANGLSQIQWVIAWSAIIFREVCFVHRSRYVCVHAQGIAGDLIICYSSSSTPTTTVRNGIQTMFLPRHRKILCTYNGAFKQNQNTQQHKTKTDFKMTPTKSHSPWHKLWPLWALFPGS